MGKGKGKASGWAAKIPSSAIFIELRNVRMGRVNHFMKQVCYKLPGSYKLVARFHSSNKNSLIAFRKTRVCYNYFF
jgi:ribosomal protein L16/L10AE